jgi:8-oxo-dGTP diphosphatase
VVLIADPRAKAECCKLVHQNPIPLPVAAAVIERGGEVLLAQRPGHKQQGLKWEFPGGKVEPGETAEAALVREIREELNCEVCLIRALPRFAHKYPEMTIEMIPFVCRLISGSPEPQPAEHLAIAWVRPELLAGYDLAAADLPIVAALQSPAT